MYPPGGRRRIGILADVAPRDAHRHTGLADALVVARDGGFADSARTSLSPGDSASAEARLAHERSGEYDVVVQKDGYERSIRRDVRVEENDCHVETVELTVGLDPN